VTTTQLIGAAIQGSMALIVFCVGLNTHRGDIAALLRKPGLLARSLAALYVVMPVVAAALAAAFDLHPAVEIALIALAVSPVPPILPSKEIRAGSTTSYAVGLLALSSLVAIVFVPAAVHLIGKVFSRPADVPVSTIARIMAIGVLVPLLLGIAVRWMAPAIADRIVKPFGIVGTAVLVLACVPILFVAWPALVAQIGDFTLVAIVALVSIGLVVGHLLGGPDPGDRTALGLSTAARHPGVAVAIAQASAPHDKSIVAAILFAFIVSFVVSMPYARWRERLHAQAVAL
jgi:BASS family bile acid:Na+ symporter